MLESKPAIDSDDPWFEAAPRFARSLYQHPVPSELSDSSKGGFRDAQAAMSLNKLLVRSARFLQVLRSTACVTTVFIALVKNNFLRQSKCSSYLLECVFHSFV